MGKRINKLHKADVVVSLVDILGSGEVTLNLKIKAPKDPNVVYGSYTKNVSLDLTTDPTTNPQE